MFVERAEAAAICAHLGLGWEWFRRRYLRRTARGARVLRLERDGRCCFLGPGNRCTVYAVRPRQCATYPVWPELVSTREAWLREARRCEGMGRGARIPLSRIERALKDAQQDAGG